MKRENGFTLAEIMIVVAIVMLLAAIAIPNLMRARITAQEAGAAGGLKTIVTAEIEWRATHATYAVLSDLEDYIDSTLASGTKQGYIYVSSPVESAEGKKFVASAVPFDHQAHSFYIDESGVLCRSDELTETPVTEHAESGCPEEYGELE